MDTRNQDLEDKSLNARITTSLLINKPESKVYELLRRFENMPKYVTYLTQVNVLDEKTSEWSVQTTKNLYKATVIIAEEKPGKMLKLQAYIGNELKGDCVINFIDMDSVVTKITADIQYHNPLGGVANLFGPLVESMLKEPKRKFIAAVEADL